MKILSNSNGTFLLNDEIAIDNAMTFYIENGYEFEDNGTGRYRCGDDYLYENVEEIDYDKETDTQIIRINYLAHEGGAKYSNVEMIGKFVGDEMVGNWTPSE